MAQEVLEPPFVEEFESSPSGWTIGLHSRADERVTKGEGAWSSEYSGSIKLQVDGGPNHIGVYHPVGDLTEGTEITVNYKSPNLQGEPGGPRITLHPPDDDSFTIDMDSGGGGSGTADTDGVLRGTLPESVPAGTEVEARLGVWPGEITVYITRVVVGSSESSSTTEEADTATATAPPAFEDRFEDGNLDGWSTVWGSRSQYCEILNEWDTTTTNAISGERSLYLHSNCDNNALATEDRIIDLSSEFEISYKYYFEEENSRGGIAMLLDSDRNGSKQGERVEGEHWYPLAGPHRRPDKDNPHFNILGVSQPFEIKPEPGTVHMVRVEKSGERIHGYHDGDQYIDASLSDVEVPLDRQYRLLLQSSGAYGAESEMWFDDIRLGQPGGTTTESSSPSDTGQGQSAPVGELQFVADIKRVVSCGPTCRDVTLSLTNAGDVEATDVTVDVTVRSGGTAIWAGSESIGSLAVGESYETQQRVDFGYEDVARIVGDDRTVLVQAIIRTNRGNLISEQVYDLSSGSVRSPSLPPLSEGSHTEVEVAGETYYLIADLPNQPVDREVVTTTDYELISPERAKAVIATDFWPQQRFADYDWEQRIQKTRDLRERSLDFYRSGSYLDVGWDITEALLFTSAHLPVKGAILDAMSDVANTYVEQTNEPWKESFVKLTASLQNTKTLHGLTNQVAWYEDIDTSGPLQTLIDFGLLCNDVVQTGTSLTQAWSRAMTAIGTGGALGQSLLQTSVKDALGEARDIFVGLAISMAVDSFDGPVKLATDAHGLAHAWTTARMPVLRRLRDLDATLAQREHSMGTGHEYYWNLLMDFQMKALAFEGSRKYWQAISDSNLGFVWDVVGNAQPRAAKYGQWAETANEMAKTVAQIYGATETAIGQRASNSLNAAVTQERPAQSFAHLSNGGTQ
ncbi:hypothetical protein [Candidatus Halobonum tyrrellensis]|uniref:hypothetical protein n=1 Tax=Candidatus Halobonum tyrrellensis TaxID=1431545 RepID=UPI001267F1A0|nr:hypothetical protein [Candidatus Halobonum tyrrellensis]